MDCNNARLLLDFARPVPGELDAAEAAALQEHLGHCPECGPHALAEQGFDRALSRAMQAVPVPADLRTRLLTRLDRERDAWYRRFAVRRVVPGVAAAAAVLFVVFFGFQWAATQKTKVNLTDLCAKVNDQYQPDRDVVDKWLRKVGGDNALFPPRFNEYRLQQYYLSNLQGQTVPTLYFAETEGKNLSAAWVYVLSENRFDLQNLKNQETLRTGNNFKVEQLFHPDTAKVMYVVVYSGDNLNRFLQSPKTPS